MIITVETDKVVAGWPRVGIATGRHLIDAAINEIVFAVFYFAIPAPPQLQFISRCLLTPIIPHSVCMYTYAKYVAQPTRYRQGIGNNSLAAVAKFSCLGEILCGGGEMHWRVHT